MRVTRNLLAAAGVAFIGASVAARAAQDAPVYKIADLDVKPRIIEKRLPFGDAPPGLLASPFRVEFVIEADGTFPNVRVLRPSTGTQPFTGEYLSLLKQWRFQPGRKGGVPVRVAVQLRVEPATSPMPSSRGRYGSLQLNIPRTTTSWILEGVEDDFGAGALRIHSSSAADVTAPRVMKEVKPVYSPEAMRAKAEGPVDIEIVIGIDGIVSAARVVRSGDPRLEDGALKAARQWLFTPASLNGEPIPAIVTLTLEFRLH